MKQIAAIFLLFLAIPKAHACLLGWQSLEGYQIVEVNSLQDFSCPLYGDYDCLTWPTNFYEWGSQCVDLSGYASSGEEGILMSNGRNVEMVTIDGIFNSPSCHSVTFYQCPSRF